MLTSIHEMIDALMDTFFATPYIYVIYTLMESCVLLPCDIFPRGPDGSDIGYLQLGHKTKYYVCFHVSLWHWVKAYFPAATI